MKTLGFHETTWVLCENQDRQNRLDRGLIGQGSPMGPIGVPEHRENRLDGVYAVHTVDPARVYRAHALTSPGGHTKK